jgi:hypothetical protein
VLPRLNYCSTSTNDVAKMVKDNLDVSVSPHMKDGFKKLKEGVESLYPCLGITCADMGEFQTSAGVYAGMEACVDPTTAPVAEVAATTAAPSSVSTESAAAMLGFAMLLLNA